MGVEGLAFAGIHRHHGAGQGGIDAGIAQLCLVAAQAGLGLADLRLVHVDPRLGGLEFGLGGLYVLIAGRTAGGEVLLALVLLPGQLVLGVLLLQLGLQVLDGEAAGIELGLLGGGVDFHQQLAFFYRVTGFHMDLADLPGGLGADIHIAARLQGAQGCDAAFDIAPAHLHGAELVAP